MKGFIKDYRQELNSEIWLMPPIYHRVWQWLKYMVNHKNNEIPMRNSSIFLIKKGQHLTSLRAIAEGVGWYENRKWKEPNPKTISSILDWLVKQEMISIERGKGNRQYTLITLLNWDYYQTKNDKWETVDGDVSKQSLDINKNEKNGKEYISTAAESQLVWYDKFIRSFNRNPNSIQAEDVGKFLDDGVEEELIIFAFEKAAMKNASYNYAQTILREWVRKGIRTIEQGKEEAKNFGLIKGGKQGGQDGRNSGTAAGESFTVGKVGRLFSSGRTVKTDDDLF